MQEQSVPVVTVDGPSGSGKGTISQIVADALEFHFLDSGALYRVLALAAERHAIPLGAEDALVPLAEHLDVQFRSNDGGTPRVILEGEDVSDAIRTESAGNAASKVASLPAVRSALLARQRAFREAPGLVADGRDMGTVVFPDAQAKVYLEASPEERAERRHKQLIEKGIDASLPTLVAEIAERDARDLECSVAPLKAAPGAIVVDTTGLSIDAVVDRIMQILAGAGWPQGVH